MFHKCGTMVAVGLPPEHAPLAIEPGYLAFFRITVRGRLVENQVDDIDALELAQRGKLEVSSTIKKLGDWKDYWYSSLIFD